MMSLQDLIFFSVPMNILLSFKVEFTFYFPGPGVNKRPFRSLVLILNEYLFDVLYLVFVI